MSTHDLLERVDRARARLSKLRSSTEDGLRSEPVELASSLAEFDEVLEALRRRCAELQGMLDRARGAAVGAPAESEPDGDSERDGSLRGDRLLALASEIVIAEERLRRALVSDLNNGVAQDIALAKMRLSHLRQSLGAEQRAPLEEIENLVEQADRSVRSITYRISPPSLHDLGLVAALEWLAEDMQENHGLSVTIEDAGAAKVAEERMRVILFRAVRELLVNAATHGRARRACVRLAADGGVLRVTVEDDGIGFDAAGLGLGGHGLFGIREQLRYVGGTLDVHSEKGRGTRVRLTAPNESEPAVRRMKAKAPNGVHRTRRR